MKTTKRASELLARTNPEQTYLRALLVFAAQNPGFEWGNYATSNRAESLAAYRSDSRPVSNQLRGIRALAWRFSDLTNEALRAAARTNFSGRVVFIEKDGAVGVDYTTGQYFATEYRLAALTVIKAALREIDRQFEAAAESKA